MRELLKRGSSVNVRVEGPSDLICAADNGHADSQGNDHPKVSTEDYDPSCLLCINLNQRKKSDNTALKTKLFLAGTIHYMLQLDGLPSRETDIHCDTDILQKC